MPSVTFCLGPALLAAVDARAEAHQQTRSAMIRDLLTVGLTSMPTVDEMADYERLPRGN